MGPLSYPNTDLFLLCFAIDSLKSFENIKSKWIAEISHYNPDTKYLVVGMKSDLREDAATIQKLEEQGRDFLSQSDGWELSETIGAIGYVECSALNIAVGNVLEEIFKFFLGLRNGEEYAVPFQHSSAN